MIKTALNIIIWVIRKIHRDQKEQEKQLEQILERKKKENEYYASMEWKEKFERAYKQCSAYGKKPKTSHKYYYRRKSAH